MFVLIIIRGQFTLPQVRNYNWNGIYTVGQKNYTVLFLDNFVKPRSILIFFGAETPE